MEESPHNEPESGSEYYPRAAPIMVGITVLLCVAMLVLLGTRWMKMAEPNGFILIHGSKDFDGAEAAVVDASTGTESRRLLSSANNYDLRFPLPQGTYRVSISMKNKPIVQQTVALQEGNGLVFNLDQEAADATQPTTSP